MAHITRTVTYNIPNKRYCCDHGYVQATPGVDCCDDMPNDCCVDDEGKTSTQTYHGPSKLILFMDKETNWIKEVIDPQYRTDQPCPKDMYEIQLDCNESDENCIRCMLIGPYDRASQESLDTMAPGPLGRGTGIAGNKGQNVIDEGNHPDNDGQRDRNCIDAPLLYEVAVGPADQPNAVMCDPTHIEQVFDQNSVVKGWNGSSWHKLTYETGRCGDDYPSNEGSRDNRDMDFIKSARNDDLLASDHKTSSDMPQEMLDAWANYRQQLRDVPADWAGVPADLILMPAAPDCTEGGVGECLKHGIPYVKIADRNADGRQAEIEAQLPDNVN